MSSWDWVGMYFKMVGMDPNRCAEIENLSKMVTPTNKDLLKQISLKNISSFVPANAYRDKSKKKEKKKKELAKKGKNP